MTAEIDAFTSPTLKHLRESWWDDSFTEFLKETLKPRSGNRILDVGCGEGVGEINIGRLRISQLRLTGIDLVPSKVVEARRRTAAHNQRVAFAAADACHLPFVDGSFDSLYCVAVLQHIADVRSALGEFARVVARNGRIVAVEPDNSGRYMFSSLASGQRAFELAAKFFMLATGARAEKADAAIGPKLPALFASHDIEPVAVRLFPVSHVSLGPPSAQVWAARRTFVERALAQVSSADARSAGQEYLSALDDYRAEASQAGTTFVEIQNTMLFATAGQRT
jgi:2-polyprenyl-3-methyl-5-hydroxy-6-metoxy-1,4-benzoquinol methylase